MKESQDTLLLFIDPHKEWLIFVESALSNTYDIVLGQEFGLLTETAGDRSQLNVAFVELSIARENIKTLERLARSPTNPWRFVVLTPGFPEATIQREFFRAGVRDVTNKPFDTGSLVRTVEEELDIVRDSDERARKRETTGSYESKVRHLWRRLHPETSNCT